MVRDSMRIARPTWPRRRRDRAACARVRPRRTRGMSPRADPLVGGDGQAGRRQQAGRDVDALLCRGRRFGSARPRGGPGRAHPRRTVAPRSRRHPIGIVGSVNRTADHALLQMRRQRTRSGPPGLEPLAELGRRSRTCEPLEPHGSSARGTADGARASNNHIPALALVQTLHSRQPCEPGVREPAQPLQLTAGKWVRAAQRFAGAQGTRCQPRQRADLIVGHRTTIRRPRAPGVTLRRRCRGADRTLPRLRCAEVVHFGSSAWQARGSIRRVLGLDIREERSGRDMQSCGQLPDRGEGGVADSGLRFPDVGASDAGGVAELLLGQTRIRSDQPERRTEGAQLSRLGFLTLHPIDAMRKLARLRPPISGVDGGPHCLDVTAS